MSLKPMSIAVFGLLSLAGTQCLDRDNFGFELDDADGKASLGKLNWSSPSEAQKKRSLFGLIVFK